MFNRSLRTQSFCYAWIYCIQNDPNYNSCYVVAFSSGHYSGIRQDKKWQALRGYFLIRMNISNYYCQIPSQININLSGSNMYLEINFNPCLKEWKEIYWYI